MPWRCLVAVMSLLLTCCGASAEALGSCRTIASLEQDCPPLPRVTHGRDLRVEIVTTQRQLSFPRPTDGDDMIFDAACPGGRCRCAETVQHLDFKGPVPGFARVNAEEQAAALRSKCSAENSTVVRSVLRFAVTTAFVSTAVDQLEYCHGCNGSCHGHAVFATYDARSGVRLALRDAVAPARLEALRARLVQDFVTKNFPGEDRRFGFAQVGDDAVRSVVADAGIYVEPGHVYLDLDTFALGCASGSLHPVEIPLDFLTWAFRARMT